MGSLLLDTLNANIDCSQPFMESVELMYAGPSMGYAACDDMIVGKTYVTEKIKINLRGDLVYMFKGIYGWKLANRFKIVK